jgi:4-hydroxymandelate oxidase
MYATGPPALGDPPGTGPLQISATARRAFDRPPEIAARPGHQAHLHEYLSDLVRPYQLRLRADGPREPFGHSYGEMAAALIEELAPPDRPVDLLVLAFAIPDVRPGRATATYLSQLCPGHPLAFAICDQGPTAAFTGLRLAGAYARTGDRARALLLVVEQAALPYHCGLPVEVPAGHTAVGLRCDPTGSAEVVSVRQHAGVPPDRVAGLLATELADAGGPGVRLIANRPLAGVLAGSAVAGQLRVVPAGRPHTGGWWELAGILAPGSGQPGPARPPGERMVLASYDPQLGYLCMSIIDTGAPRPG